MFRRKHWIHWIWSIQRWRFECYSFDVAKKWKSIDLRSNVVRHNKFVEQIKCAWNTKSTAPTTTPSKAKASAVAETAAAAGKLIHLGQRKTYIHIAWAFEEERETEREITSFYLCLNDCVHVNIGQFHHASNANLCVCASVFRLLNTQTHIYMLHWLDLLFLLSFSLHFISKFAQRTSEQIEHYH